MKVIAHYLKSSGPMLVRAADINNDNILDLLVVQPFLSELTFYPRLQNYSWGPETFVAGGDAGVTWVDFCDIDGDGMQDLVVTIYRGNYVGWHRQLVPGQYDSLTIIGSVPSAMSVSCVDINLDGLMDVVVVGMDSDSLCW